MFRDPGGSGRREAKLMDVGGKPGLPGIGPFVRFRERVWWPSACAYSPSRADDGRPSG
jgi:hypothetical protein